MKRQNSIQDHQQIFLAGLQEQMRKEKETYFKSQLTKICEPYIGRQTVFSKLNARALKYISGLFTFVRFPNIPSDNNRAEQALRHLVVARIKSLEVEDQREDQKQNLF